MGYLRFSEERLSWKSSHRSIASAANRSFSEVGISLAFSQTPFGHSSLTPPPVRNISAGLAARCTLDKASEHSSPEVLNICGGAGIVSVSPEMCGLTSDPWDLWTSLPYTILRNLPMTPFHGLSLCRPASQRCDYFWIAAQTGIMNSHVSETSPGAPIVSLEIKIWATRCLIERLTSESTKS
jgi:hypothetical protein